MKEKKNKVVVIIDSIKRGGGAEKNAALLATLLFESDVDVTLLTFHSFQNEYPYSCPRISFVEESKNSFIKKIFKAIRRLQQINRFCADNDISHIISFLDQANRYTILTRILLRNKSKIIVSVRADPSFASKKKQLIIKMLYPFAHKVVGVSLQMEQILRKQFGLSNVTTIYNPVDKDLVSQLMQDPLLQVYRHLEDTDAQPIFINVGRLSKQKGHIDLIKIFFKFVKDYPKARLLIVGDGVEKNNLLREIERKHLEKNAFLIGHQDNIYPFLRISDCFLLSSVYEGFPNVLLEAAASGLYIISTDCNTGPREIINPKKFGEKLSYPCRINGASLVSDFSQVEVTANLFYQEMVWFAKNKLTEKQSITIDQFSKQIFLNKWLDLLI